MMTTTKANPYFDFSGGTFLVALAKCTPFCLLSKLKSDRQLLESHFELSVLKRTKSYTMEV